MTAQPFDLKGVQRDAPRRRLAEDRTMAKPNKPRVLNVCGEAYVPIMLLIHTKNPDGSPALMKHITDDQTIDLVGGEEFMIAYAPKSMIKPGRTPGKPSVN
jgi:hypothetical protein